MNLLHYQHVHKIGKVREKFFYDSRHLKYFTWDLTLHIQGYEVNLFSPTCNLVFFCVVVLRFEMAACIFSPPTYQDSTIHLTITEFVLDEKLQRTKCRSFLKKENINI